MTPKEFVLKYYPDAVRSSVSTGIPVIATLAQAALESSWGEAAPGFMFFGIKDTDGINGNEQLLTTTEYSRSALLKFPQIIYIVPVMINGQKFFKYKVKDYFRKYASAEESFTDHARFFLKNKRYKDALKQSDPYKFIEAISAAGYASAPNYSQVLTAIASKIETIIKANKL